VRSPLYSPRVAPLEVFDIAVHRAVLRRPPGFPAVGQHNQDERIGAVLQEGRHEGRAIIEPRQPALSFPSLL
jgi:hypothetical protein